MYELIEDLYFLKAKPSRKDANWFLSAGNHKAIITSLRFGLPIILKMTGKILDDLKLSQDKMNELSNECNKLRDQLESTLLTSNEELDRHYPLNLQTRHLKKWRNPMELISLTLFRKK